MSVIANLNSYIKHTGNRVGMELSIQLRNEVKADFEHIARIATAKLRLHNEKTGYLVVGN